MVLEDLVASGWPLPHPKYDAIAWRARDIVENLAAFPSGFCESPRFDDGGASRGSAPQGTGAAAGGSTFCRLPSYNFR